MRFLSFSLAALVAVSMSGCGPDEKATSQTTVPSSAKVIPSLTEAGKAASQTATVQKSAKLNPSLTEAGNAASQTATVPNSDNVIRSLAEAKTATSHAATGQNSPNVSPSLTEAGKAASQTATVQKSAKLNPSLTEAGNAASQTATVPNSDNVIRSLAEAKTATSHAATGQNSPNVIPSLTPDEEAAVKWLFETGDEDRRNPNNAAKYDSLAAINEEALKKYLTDCDFKTSLICGIKNQVTLESLDLELKVWNSASEDLKNVLRQQLVSYAVSQWKRIPVLKEIATKVQAIETSRKNLNEAIAAKYRPKPNIFSLTEAEKAARQTKTGQNSPKGIPSLTEVEKAAVTSVLQTGYEILQNPDNSAKFAAISEGALEKYLTESDSKSNLIFGVAVENLHQDFDIISEDWHPASKNVKNAIRQYVASQIVCILMMTKVPEKVREEELAIDTKLEAIKENFLKKLAAEKEAKQNSLSTF